MGDFFSNHSIVIGSQGYFGNFQNGQHVYSFDMIAKMLHRIRKNFPMAGVFTAISGTYSKEHRKQIFHIRKDFGLEDHWFFLEAPCPVAALYSKCSLFIRPTVTDGDSVSIRECMQLNVPVLASDCVSRPRGVLIFSSRNQGEFEDMVIRLLKNRIDPIEFSSEIIEKAKTSVSRMIEYYKNILE